MPTAGKTGTTDDDKDRWFIGYSPYYVSAVWYGYDRPTPIVGVPNNDNPAALIWNAVMQKIHQNKAVTDFPMPENIVKKRICVYSGKIATETCTHDPRGDASFEEYFIKGTEPKDTDLCDVHVVARVCKDAKDIWGRNLLAGSGCPQESILERVFIQRKIPFRPLKSWDPYPLDWKYELPAGEYCNIHGLVESRSIFKKPEQEDQERQEWQEEEREQREQEWQEEQGEQGEQTKHREEIPRLDLELE